MMYLGNAIVYIYRAAICPDNEPLGCTEPVAYAVTVARRKDILQNLQLNRAVQGFLGDI